MCHLCFFSRRHAYKTYHTIPCRARNIKGVRTKHQYPFFLLFSRLTRFMPGVFLAAFGFSTALFLCLTSFLHLGNIYVTETHLSSRCDMLLHTDMSISEIAAKCGFQNVNHFSVKFKNQYNESPTVWRRLNSVI